MNKKFLSAVLFGALMVGSSVTFTGCIDNDEPAGIENLRGAKAELLRAKIAVEAANAARENAEAARILALAEVEKANAAFRNAQAAMEQAKADKEAARTEEEKARIEKQIAQYKMEMEEAALQHQNTMLGLQKDYAEAKSKFELLLKEIEIAQTLVTGDYKTELSTVKQAVTDAYNDIYAADGWVEKVYEAEKSLYNAQLDKAQGGQDQESWIPELELNVARKEGNLAAAETKVQLYKDFLAKDAATADWRKEITTLEDSIAKLKLVISNYDVECTKIEKSDEYVAADKAVKAAQTALDDIATSKYTYKYKYDETKSYGRKTFEIADKTAIKPGNKTEGAEFDVNTEIKGVEGQLALYTTQKIAILDEVAANQEALIESTKATYNDALKAWKDAKAKYDAVGNYNATAAKEAIVKAEKSYTDAIAAASTIMNPDMKAEAIANARIAYAKALVAYYTEANKYVGCTTAEVTLDIMNPAGQTEKVKKTVLAWLSDATYSGTYLDMILRKYSNAAAMYTEGQAIKTIGSKETLLTDLIAKSSAAFGDELLNGKEYMYVEPTTEEIRAIENYSTVCGAAGKYYFASDPSTIEEANNYKAIMADFEAAITSLKAKAAAMDEAVAGAKTTLATKKAEFKVLNDKLTAVKTKKGVAEASQSAIETVKGKLVAAVNTYLTDINLQFADTKAFEKVLQDAVEGAEDEVISAQKALAKAQRNLKEAQEGKYDAVAEAQKDLDEANEGLSKAQKDYEVALANLETALEIMAKSAE